MVDEPPEPEAWSRTQVTITGRGGEGWELPLTASGSSAWPQAIMLPGATGLDAPPFGLFSDDSPGLDGSIFRSARASAREVMIPVYLHGIDRPTINALKRRLFKELNPKAGPCVLRFTEGDNSTRLLTAYYKGGMEGAEGDSSGFTWSKYGLTFVAMDPWYYDEREISKRFLFGEGDPLLSPTKPFFPMRIADGVLGDGYYFVDNPGDIEAWPIWRLKGPIKSFKLSTESAPGEVSAIKATAPADGSDIVPSGRTLTIDTRPGRKTVADDRGVNYWAKLDTNPTFWPLESGGNAPQLSVVTGSGKASVTLNFTPRYATYA
ncbi:phage tail domain-containing protein [Streptomyces sp. YIM 121038]|uniref:phage tail domain-containing protein n=1 Tax=Streptomyces sp. YIM 121038 TaxID=2136401 RepID=UPI002018117B|nr:phage tail domain-containing protein [Streptomyces sp. YIM 121038]